MGYLLPIDEAPPCCDEICAAVLIFEIVGMLPDVHAQDRRHVPWREFLVVFDLKNE